MKRIKLTQGQKALIDDEDFERVSKIKWCALKRPYGGFYVVGTIGDIGARKRVFMHRFILGITDSKTKVDHKDLNGLNNQKKNIRVATHGQNIANMPSKKGSVSKYKGVSWCKDIKQWRAQIMKEGKYFGLGCFKNEIDAALAYNKKAIELHGEFAFLNNIS